MLLFRSWGQTTAVITTFAVPQLTQPDAANLGPKVRNVTLQQLSERPRLRVHSSSTDIPRLRWLHGLHHRLRLLLPT